VTGAVRVLRPGVAAPAGTLSDLEMLIALASALGVEVPDPVALHRQAAADAPWVAGGFGDPALLVDGESNVPSRDAVASGLRLVIAADLFSGGGTVYHDDQLGELRPQATVALSERTAAVAEVHDGDLVDIVAGERTLSGLVVRVGSHYVDGTVTILEGLPDAPASVFEGGQTVVLANIRAARTAVGVA
jgi:hypothetical protein